MLVEVFVAPLKRLACQDGLPIFRCATPLSPTPFLPHRPMNSKASLTRPIRLGRWRPAPASPEVHVESQSIRVGDTIYMLGGFQTMTQMCSKMQIADVETGTWRLGPELPEGFPLSHAGVASDGRYVFFVSGQPGPACQPATNRAWALHLADMTWHELAPLPVARYSPMLEYVDGTLHLISGATEDRETISTDHFVLPIRPAGSKATSSLPGLKDQVWGKGLPIPQGGDHAASVVLDGKIFAIGGEHGHAPMTMDTAMCCGAYWAHDYLFCFDPEDNLWERLAPMPFGVSHIETQVVVIEGRILVLGGAGNHDTLTDRVQEYDPSTNRWRQLKPLPFPRKGGIVWQHQGVLYFNGGQTLSSIPAPLENGVLSSTMAAPIGRETWLDAWSLRRLLPRKETRTITTSVNQRSALQKRALPLLPIKTVVLISHDWTRTGSPLLLIETALEMQKAGFNVRVAALQDDFSEDNPAVSSGVPLIPIADAFSAANEADLVVANTAEASMWIDSFRVRFPHSSARVVWWIHELDPRKYADSVVRLDHADALIFDSQASLDSWENAGYAFPAFADVVHPGVSDTWILESQKSAFPLSLPSCQRRWMRDSLHTREEIRQHLGVQSGDFLVAFFGCYAPEAKGQDLFLQSVERLLALQPDSPVKLLLIGFWGQDGIDEFLRERSSSLCKAVDRRRVLEMQKDLAPFYFASDALVSNSQGLGENFGRVIIEAMAFGVPVLISDGGGAGEIVGDCDTGLLHPIGEAGRKKLASNLLSLIDNPEHAKIVGDAGRRRVHQRFNSGRFISDLSEALRKLFV